MRMQKGNSGVNMRKANNMDENKYNLKWLNIKWYIVKIKTSETQDTLYLIFLYHGSEKKNWIIKEMFILKECQVSEKYDTQWSTQMYPDTVANLWW